jgi:hypothetical protein
MRVSSSLVRRVRPLALPALFLLAIAGCGTSSQLVNTWSDPSFRDGPMSRVLVLGMVRDPARRRTWEDRFVAELEKNGVDATPSYRVFPNALPDTNAIIDVVNRKGYDGFIVTSRLPTRTRTAYVPGRVESYPVTRYSPWRRAYVTYWNDLYYPGYVETERVVRYRTDVWSMAADGRLVWSGTTEIFDPSSSRSVNREIAERIVPALAKGGIVRGNA